MIAAHGPGRTVRTVGHVTGSSPNFPIMTGMKTLLAMILLAMSAHAAAAGSPQADFNAAFDRQKGRIYALYTRALRDQPGLAGKIVYDIDIAKTGDVTGCRVRSSTLRSPTLEDKICGVMLQLKLPPQASGTTITKPVDFFPTL